MPKAQTKITYVQYDCKSMEEKPLWKKPVTGPDYLVVEHLGMTLELCFEKDALVIHRNDGPLWVCPYEGGLKLGKRP